MHKDNDGMFNLYDAVDDATFLEVIFDVMEEFIVDNFEDIMEKINLRLQQKLAGIQGIYRSGENH